MMTELTTQNGDTAIQSHSYTYLPNGNISGKQSTLGTQTTNYVYQYDKAGRLTNETINSASTAYTYDAWSNRASMTGNGTSSTYTYDANNRLTKSITEQGSTKTTADYYYDHNGNNISKMVMTNASKDENAIGRIFLSTSTDENVALYEYNSYNQLVKVDTDGKVTTYAYDGSNLRQSKTTNGVTTQHIWDGSNMVMDGTNKFYRGATGIEFATLNGNTSFYHKDAHGDVTALTDAAGTITQSYIYDAFGNQMNENENDTNPFRYCGEYLDNETGLIYLRNRYYDNSTGRFITEDPIKDGLNWYVYCGNNPVIFVDPLGLIGITPDGSIYMDQTDTETDRKLLLLKIDYKNSNSPFERDHIARKAQNLRNENPGRYKVMAEHSLEGYYIPDLTSEIDSIIDNNEENFREHRRDFDWFAQNVKTGALVDVKNSNADVFSRPSYSYHIIYNGEVMRGDASGNILYGYLGTAAGFDEFELLACAGIYQIHEDKKNLFLFFDGNYGDNPGDGEQIVYGIALYYESKNPGYVFPMPMPGPKPMR